MGSSELLMIYTSIIEMGLRVEEYLEEGLFLPQGSTLNVSVKTISNGFEELSLFRSLYVKLKKVLYRLSSPTGFYMNSVDRDLELWGCSLEIILDGKK